MQLTEVASAATIGDALLVQTSRLPVQSEALNFPDMVRLRAQPKGQVPQPRPADATGELSDFN